MTATLHYVKPDPKAKKIVLKDQVSKILDQYFATLEDQKPSNLYDLVLEEVEPAILEAVMKFTDQNQSASIMVLGLNRGTFRKKLEIYGMINPSEKPA